MIEEVRLGRACDTLQQALTKEVEAGRVALQKDSILIQAQQRQIALRDQAASVQTERIMNQQKANGELKKEIRQQRRLTVAVGILGVLAVLIAL